MSKSADATSMVLAVCAVLLTATAAYRTFGRAPQVGGATLSTGMLEAVSNWDALVASRTFVGPSSAPVRIVEFVDYECPACGGYVRTIDSLLKRYPESVAFGYAHFPLTYHRFAMPAARVAECTVEFGGDIVAISRALLTGQDSLGLKSWASYAAASGVADTVAFGQCATRTSPLPREDRDKALARESKVAATPTVIVNGMRFPHPPSLEVLDSIVRSNRR